MRTIVLIGAGVIGAAIGSFLSVVVHRVPLGESVAKPASRCPHCGAPLRAIDNVPVVGFLLRRGRCRSCDSPISVRYLVLELATAAAFVLVSFRAPTLWVAPALCVATATLIAVGTIDIAHLRIPTRILYAGAALGAPLLVMASAGTGEWAPLLHALIASVVALAVFLIVYLVSPKGMGFGDVRLATFCALFLGWLGYRVAAVGMVLSFVVGGLFAIALVLAGKAGRKSKLPFGPFLALGTVASFLYGPHLAHLWLG